MRSQRARRRLCLFSLMVGVLASAPVFAADSQQADAQRAHGQQIYVREGCQVCHGGMGFGGVGPAFVGDRFLPLTDYVVTRILVGGGEMPAFENKVSDADVAAVANYIRTTWGNQSSEITAKQVTAQRKKLSSEARKEAAQEPK